MALNGIEKIEQSFLASTENKARFF